MSQNRQSVIPSPIPVASAPGLPRKSDGSLLFLLHLASHMRALEDGGSRIGIVLNGSPLFTGAAGSGESEIRRYLLEHDLVEAIVALPTDMFLNTEDFGYTTVNRPLRDEAGNVVTDKQGKAKPDPKLKDTENIPLKVDVDSYFAEQVRPHVPDAWMDRSKDRIGVGYDRSSGFRRRFITAVTTIRSASSQ